MNVSLKTEINGVLDLIYDNRTGEFSYVLKHVQYPSYEIEIVKIEEGDVLTVRSLQDTSIVIRREVDFDYDSYKSMDIHTGKYYQMVLDRRVSGVQKNIEPSYWLQFFLNNHPATLVKSE